MKGDDISERLLEFAVRIVRPARPSAIRKPPTRASAALFGRIRISFYILHCMFYIFHCFARFALRALSKDKPCSSGSAI